ncbi:MAG: hypothetical protein KGM44_12585 [bacterium]|nr:hypothetical protein [bacterium]
MNRLLPIATIDLPRRGGAMQLIARDGYLYVDIGDPEHPRELAACVPDAPAGQRSAQVNDLFVDRDGIVFASDRGAGRVYILEAR